MSAEYTYTTRWQHINIGWNLYTDFQLLADCQNEYQERGWWAALKADADTDTAAHLARANDHAIENEYENIRRGM